MEEHAGTSQLESTGLESGFCHWLAVGSWVISHLAILALVSSPVKCVIIIHLNAQSVVGRIKLHIICKSA